MAHPSLYAIRRCSTLCSSILLGTLLTHCTVQRVQGRSMAGAQLNLSQHEAHSTVITAYALNPSTKPQTLSPWIILPNRQSQHTWHLPAKAHALLLQADFIHPNTQDRSCFINLSRRLSHQKTVHLFLNGNRMRCYA